MSERYKVIDSETPTFVTFTIVGWVDLFIRRDYTNILYDSLEYCIKEKGLRIHAFVFMTSHVHLILTSSSVPLNAIIRDFKKHTSRELIKAIKEIPESRREWLLNKFSYAANRTIRGSHYKVWQDGFHPVLLDTNKKLKQRVDYIHYNPIDTGLVDAESNWAHSSYLAYSGDEISGHLPIITLW